MPSHANPGRNSRKLMRMSLFAAAIPCVLTGCIARTALDVVTAPVRITGQAVDAVTTSQSEADEKRGRELRRREERLGQLDRKYEKELQACESGDEAACAKARATYEEIQSLLPGVPVEN